jgi:hypothetical protein
MNNYYIYAVIHRRNENAYVGCTERVDRRWIEHKRQLTLGLHRNSGLQAAWNQDGEDAFTFVILAVLVDATRALAKRSELEWIARIGTYNEVKADLLNQRFVLPTELRLMLAEKNRERGRSEAYRKNISEHTKRRWADPELRKPMAEALARGNGFYKGMPSVKPPEQIAAHSQHMKELWADPKKRKKLEARREARWKDPEARERQAEKMRAYHARRRELE